MSDALDQRLKDLLSQAIQGSSLHAASTVKQGFQMCASEIYGLRQSGMSWASIAQKFSRAGLKADPRALKNYSLAYFTDEMKARAPSLSGSESSPEPASIPVDLSKRALVRAMLPAIDNALFQGWKWPDICSELANAGFKISVSTLRQYANQERSVSSNERPTPDENGASHVR